MSKVDEPKDAASDTPVDGFAYWVHQVRPELEPLISGVNPNFSIDSPEKQSKIHKFLCKPGPTWPGVDATKLEVEGIGTLYSPSNKGREGRSPAGTASGVLWIHGGGRIMGCSNGEQEAVACSRFVIELGIPVLSLEHTLVFPAALDDAVKAYRWFVRRLESEGTAGQSAKIAIAGESGGAGIAAELGQRLLDEKRQGGTTDVLSTPACQLLIYPMLDDRTCVNDKMNATPLHMVWNNKSNMYAWSNYFGPDHEPGDKSLPKYASASRRVDLSGLPPAYIHVGSIELFHDECSEYAQRLGNAGVDVEFAEMKGGFHGVMTMNHEEAIIVESWKRILTFALKYLAD